MGAATRKLKVTPSGTPARRKPMNSGTAEQEQNGVMIPSREARALPAREVRFDRASRTLAGLTKVWRKVTMNTMRVRRRRTLGTS